MAQIREDHGNGPLGVGNAGSAVPMDYGTACAVAPSPRSWGNRTRVYPSSVIMMGRSRIYPTSAERVGVRGKPVECAFAPHPISPRKERGEGADRVCVAADHTLPD